VKGRENSNRIWARRLAVGLLVLLIGAAAYPYGSVELWASEWLRFGAILCLGILLWSGSPARLVAPPAGRLALWAAALVLWAGIQAAPMPRFVVRMLSPKVAAIHEASVVPGGGQALPGWLLDRATREGVRLAEGARATPGLPDRGDPSAGRTLSLYPFATRRAALAWITPILLFLAAARVSRDPMSRYHLLWGVSAWAGAYGLAALLQALGWNGAPLWTPQEASDLVPMLPFINRNHLAGYLAMGALVAIGLALAVLCRPSGRLDRPGIKRALTDRAWAAPRLLVLGVVIVLAVLGLLVSRSRGGALAFLFGALVLAGAKVLRGRIWIPLALVVALGIGVGIVGLAGPGQAGMETGSFSSKSGEASTVVRLDLWAKTFRMFLDHPLTGTGLGTFQWGFASYQREGEWGKLDYAHNDYLQLLSETGLVGAVLLVGALLTLFGRILVPALRSIATRPRFTSVGAAAALAAILAHSVVDGDLQIPADAALFAILLGVLAAAAREEEQRAAEEAAP